MKTCRTCKHRTLFYNCKKHDTSCKLALSYSRFVCCSNYYDWEYKKTILDKIKEYLLGTTQWWNYNQQSYGYFYKNILI